MPLKRNVTVRDIGISAPRLAQTIPPSAIISRNTPDQVVKTVMPRAPCPMRKPDATSIGTRTPYVNTKRSFIRFLLKTSSNGVLVPQANVFRRMLLKSSRGQVLEDIDNYDTLCRIFQNMKSEATLKGEAVSSKDIRAVDVAKNFGNMTNATGQNVRHHLMSGILGDHQEFLVPISALAAGSGFAFQLELFLNDDAKVVGSGVLRRNRLSRSRPTRCDRLE